jgi:hypothetical protein
MSDCLVVIFFIKKSLSHDSGQSLVAIELRNEEEE